MVGISFWLRNLLRLIIICELTGCSGDGQPNGVTIWAMGSEGEALEKLVFEYERQNPDVSVRLQQIPWSAAQEKLLTAFAGDALPDVFQIGNTQIAEFVTLGAIEPIASGISREDFSPGVLEANTLDGVLWAVPWYIDTRVLFYRKDLLAEAGWSEPPKDWSGWMMAMQVMREKSGGQRYGIFLPVTEWQMPIILGLQFGAEFLSHDSRLGAFESASFEAAFSLYLEFFQRGLSPPVIAGQVANLYQEFAKGYFAVFLSGPWSLGELRRRMPPSMRDAWATSPLPSPDGHSVGMSLAGGASLVIARSSRNKSQALELVKFLTRPEQQLALYRSVGDLPANRSAWESPDLAEDSQLEAFRRQLSYIAGVPRVPEWERIASKIAEYTERTVRGDVAPVGTLRALDQEVDRILEKRRWLFYRRSLQSR